MKTQQLEVLFVWNCPDCKTPQHDTVNPDLGPFGSVICGQCGKAFDDSALTHAERAMFHAAGDRALQLAGYDLETAGPRR